MTDRAEIVTCPECSYDAHYRQWAIKNGELVCPLCGTPESGKPEPETQTTNQETISSPSLL
jgi:uncharacterized Zn finger protein (UPF0148 family)